MQLYSVSDWEEILYMQLPQTVLTFSDYWNFRLEAFAYKQNSLLDYYW